MLRSRVSKAVQERPKGAQLSILHDEAQLVHPSVLPCDVVPIKVDNLLALSLSKRVKLSKNVANTFAALRLDLLDRHQGIGIVTSTEDAAKGTAANDVPVAEAAGAIALQLWEQVGDRELKLSLTTCMFVPRFPFHLSIPLYRLLASRLATTLQHLRPHCASEKLVP
eukprot:scaffold635_cov311-Pinguiococcus_pyrenoidosus.AAC.20